MYFSPGVASGGLRRDALEEQSARARGRALVLPEFAPQFILCEITGCAAAVGEELFERDGLVLGVHRLLQLGKRLAEGLIPFQFSFIDEDAAEHGGHRLGVGADVEAVGGGDLVRLAARADAGDAEGDGLAVADDGGGHAGDVVLLDDGGEERGDVLRRARGVDGDGREAEQGESNGENGFHMRGSWFLACAPTQSECRARPIDCQMSCRHEYAVKIILGYFVFAVDWLHTRVQAMSFEGGPMQSTTAARLSAIRGCIPLEPNHRYRCPWIFNGIRNSDTGARMSLRVGRILLTIVG